MYRHWSESLTKIINFQICSIIKFNVFCIPCIHMLNCEFSRALVCAYIESPCQLYLKRHCLIMRVGTWNRRFPSRWSSLGAYVCSTLRYYRSHVIIVSKKWRRFFAIIQPLVFVRCSVKLSSNTLHTSIFFYHQRPDVALCFVLIYKIGPQCYYIHFLYAPRPRKITAM